MAAYREFKELSPNASAGAKLTNWFENRFPTAFDAYKVHMSEYYAPKNFNFWYIFGSLALVVLVIQIVTGIFLVMHYKPDAALAFASVSVLFSTMALQLSSGPLGLDDGQIGLIGLAGAAGALVATQAGRLVDKGLGRVSCAIGALALLLSWPLLWVGGAHLGWFVLGMVVIDLGLQCLNITNQATVAQLLPAARGRMNAVYMTGYFTGAAAGSALGTLAWRINGWQGACALGLALALLACLGTFRMRKSHGRLASLV